MKIKAFPLLLIFLIPATTGSSIKSNPTGSLKSSGVAVSFDFGGWSTKDYVMIPAIVYNGNRFRTIHGGYMPVYPTDMYYNKNCPLSFSDDPRLAMNEGEPSKIELSTSSASTPAMTFFSPTKKRGYNCILERRG